MPKIKDKLTLRLRLGRGSLCAALAVVLMSAVFLALEWPIAIEKDSAGRQALCWEFVLAFSGLSALTAGLCFIEVNMPAPLREGLGWLLVVLLPLGAFVAVDVINGTRIWQFPGRRWAANYLCYLLVFALAYALTRRAWGAAAIGGAVAMTFGIANYFVVQFRGQPILPWDFQSFATAMTVSGGYEYVPTQKMALAAMGYIGAVVLCYKLSSHDAPEPPRSLRLAERFSALAVSVLLVVLLFPLNGLSGLGISVWTWNQKTSSEITGVAAGFFANVNFMLVEEPKGYSSARAGRLAEAILQESGPAPLGQPKEKPTIIAIMNESMTDLGSLGTLRFTPDNQPFLHSLQKSGQVVHGTAYSSVYGGNTCNSEYEFLTGNTMAFLPSGSKPYQQYIDEPHSGLPEILKSYGYHCTAIHPGDRTAWQRIEAYPHLGFDEFVDAEIFDVDRRFEHRLTSDESSYRQVIFEYERWRTIDDSPLFLFNVTIQNHGGYEDPNYQTTVRVSGAEGRWPQAEQYLSLTRSSDRALEDLLDYFEAQPDPVVILFFGDHWPKLEDGFNRAVLQGYDASTDMYRVPFFLWANYPLKGEEIEAVSLNYLSGLLLRAAGLQGTGYTNYLENLRQQLPVVTDIGYIDQEGNRFVSEAFLPQNYAALLNEYAVLQYNNSFDPGGKVAELFQR